MPGAEVDVVVVGMGPGGEDVGARLARAGLDVVGVDGRLVGGECPYYACIPTKMMIRAADALGEARRVPVLAGAADVTLDWAPVARRIREEATDNWDDRVAVERFESAGGTFVRGWGRITAPREVTVTTPDGTERVFTARRGVVLNTGTDPAVPAIDGLAETPYWTNRDAVAVEEVPGSLVVLGGGPVGCELAQVFSRFGANVTIVQHSDRLVAADEPEAGELLEKTFAGEGITVRTGLSAARVSYESGQFQVKLDNGEVVNAAEYHAVPRVTFTDPEIGSVGLSEAAARDKGLNVRVGLSELPYSSRGFIHKIDNAGFIKVVEDADRGVLVGATAVGPAGGEILGALVVAVHAEVPVKLLRQMIYAYPTFHRAIEDAINKLA